MRALRQSWNLFINLGLILLTTSIFLIGAEEYFRIENRFYPVQRGWVGQFQTRHSANFIVDAHTGWRVRPNHSFTWDFDRPPKEYRSNSQGFRSSSDFDAGDRRYKIAFVGDSFTFGTGVWNEETFPALIEKGAPDRVSWNFGMPGFGVDQVWLSARYQALPLKPDLLVVGLINADFDRSLAPFRRTEGFAKPTFKLVNGQLIQRTTEQPPNAVMRYLDENSRVWSMWQRARQWVGIHYSRGEYWTLNQAILDAIREDCRKTAVPVLFVYIPIKGLEPFQALPAYMRRTGAAYIDLTEQRPVPPRSIYLPNDSHLSAEGHRYVANLIDQWLKSHPQPTAQAHP